MTHTITLTQDYGYSSYRTSGLDGGSTIDASDASWTVANIGGQINRYPFQVSASAPGLTVLGGIINGEVSQTLDWQIAYVNSAAVRVENAPGATIQDWRITRPWDGIRVKGNTNGFTIDNVWISESRDDAIENDDALGGTIRDSLFDGVFSGISLGDGDADGHNNVVTLDGVLLRGKSYLYKGEITHGSPLKLDKSSPDVTPSLRIFDTIFAVEHSDHEGQSRLAKAWAKTIEASGNYLLNLSDDPFDADYPLPGAGWTVLQGQAARSYWNAARAEWIESRDSGGGGDPGPTNGPVAFDTPADVDPATNQIAVNAAAGTRVGVTASATDPDAGDAVTYSVDDARFAIDAGGVITRSRTGVLDFDAEPTVSLAVTATSTDGSRATRQITLNVVDSGQTVEVRIAASRDDVEQRSSGPVDFTSSDLELVDDSPSRLGQTIGLRFNGLDIPQGAVITGAHIQFQVDETNTGTATLQIRGDDTDNARAFSTAAFDVSSRQSTAATVSWTPPNWTSVGNAGAGQRTADVSSIIQEIVNRSGWAADNSIALIITGRGERTAESFDGNASAAPLLHVEWVLPNGRLATTPSTVALDAENFGGPDTATMTGDPLYTDTFRLRPGSPAIDAVPDMPPSEYSGATSDLGWFEF